LSDAVVLEKRYGSLAGQYCADGADAYLTTVAKYDFKWDPSFLDDKFDRYLPKVVQPGILMVVSNHLMVQNGYGAYKRTMVGCIFSTQTDTVLGYTVD
jgi:hypothetical protein